jgi:hypothetical protein
MQKGKSLLHLLGFPAGMITETGSGQRSRAAPVPAWTAASRRTSRPLDPACRNRRTAVSVFNTSISHHITPVNGSARQLGVPPAVQLRQRQHPGPAGTAGHLRARRPPGYPHRARRLDYRAGRRLPGQAAERAQRRGRGGRRGGLVQRPGLRHPRRLRGLPGRAGAADLLVPARPDGRLDAAAELRSPNGLAFSPDESVLYVVESRAVPRTAGSSPTTCGTAR